MSGFDCKSDSKDSITIHDFTFSKELIFDNIKKLNVTKGPGPDGVPPALVKSCCSSFVEPLFLLFNKSLKEATFPLLWKSGIIVPIFKDGDNSDLKNYRPITILNVFAKLFEGLISEVISVATYNVIIPEQHAFVRARSVSTNLAVFSDFIVNNLEGGSQIDVVYTDFSKAFDKVDHFILMAKLAHMGFHGNILTLIESYLSNRSLTVRVAQTLSKQFWATSGVPQGSLLGPLLFTLFINDIGDVFHHCLFLLYADDLKFYKIISNHIDFASIQSDFNRLQEWCIKNNLLLNHGKCSVISFSKRSIIFRHQYKCNSGELNRVEWVRDLGVIMCESFSFAYYIDNVVNRAVKTLGFIIRNASDFKNALTIKLLYFSLVRSLIEYASLIYSPYYNVEWTKIERVQNRFLRFAARRLRLPCNYFGHEYGYLREVLCIPTIKSRFLYADLLFLYNILNGKIYCPSILTSIKFAVPIRSTRNYSFFHLKFHRTNYGLNSIFYRLCNEANDVMKNYNIDFFNTSEEGFKLKLRSILF